MTVELTDAGTRAAIELREATAGDAESCGRIFYDAFDAIAKQHALPTEPASPEFTHWRTQAMLDNPGFHGFVAERDGAVVGILFLDERGAVVGVGPVAVDPAAMDAGVGRALIEAAVARERERGAPAVRLVQTAYHYRSFALYSKLGFELRAALTVVQGELPAIAMPGHDVRPAAPDDVDAAAELCRRVHGHDRRVELDEAVDEGTAAVVERGGRLTGYATGFGYGWHAVAETNDDLKALLGSAPEFMGLGFFVPSRNAELLKWCLANGLRIVQQSILMTSGLYSEPAGAWLPSILF